MKENKLRSFRMSLSIDNELTRIMQEEGRSRNKVLLLLLAEAIEARQHIGKRR